jgi:dihydroorotate dehydrogenase electron transfer subunit
MSSQADLRKARSVRGVFTADVLANTQLCDQHSRLVLSLAAFGPSRAGQFVQLQCRPLGEQVAAREIPWPSHGFPCATQPELTGREPMLRRPLSLAGRRDRSDGSVELDIIYRTIGTGTHWLAGVKAGDKLSVLGPLGNGFTLRPEKSFAAVVGGGVGIPPMLYLSAALTAAGKAAAAFCGARSGNLLPVTLTPSKEPSADGRPTPCVQEFTANCTDAAVATDDGTLGFHGLVSEAFTLWLKDHDFDPRDVVVYCCGPEPMERAVADICLMRDIECQLALERHMACGMGTCQSCVVKIRDDTPRGWSFRLCCTDGPVFDARDVLW